MTIAQKKENIKSPCRNICKITADTGLCIGCFRSIQEISVWKDLTEKQRSDILLLIEERRNHAQD